MKRDLELRLAARYARPEWALLFEVTGKNGRRADALALNLWRSRRHVLYGFEIKNTRADWLAELREPAKAEAWWSYCDVWWIVAPKDVVKVEELPAGWGLLTPWGQRLRQVHRPTLNIDPLPLDRSLVSRLVSSTANQAVSERQRIYQLAYKDGRQSAKKDEERRESLDTQQLNQLRERVKVFEETAGIGIGTYNAGNIGAAVRRVLAAEEIERRIQGLSSQVEQILEATKAALSS